MQSRKKRSPTPDEHTELVQTRISNEAKLMLDAKAGGQAISLAAYVRQVLYRDLGLIKGT